MEPFYDYYTKDLTITLFESFTHIPLLGKILKGCKNLKRIKIDVDDNNDDFMPINPEVIKNLSLTDLILNVRRGQKFTEYLLRTLS
jgi:hypothetical protein